MTPDQFLTEYKREVPKSRYTDTQLKGLADIVVRKLLTKRQKRFMINLLPIKNREVDIPKDFYMITNIFYLAPGDYVVDEKKVEEYEKKGLTLEECICKATDDCEETKDGGFKYTLKDTRCDNHCIMDILLNPSFLAFEDYKVSSNYEIQYKPGIAYIMRPTMNDFFNLKYHVTGCINLNADTGIEYQITTDKIIVNMDEGYVMLSYLADYKDRDGYYLIPDNPFVIDAIKHSLYEREGMRQVLQNAADGHNKGFWRDMLALIPRKMVAAKAELMRIRNDQINTIFETRWATNTYNQGPFGEYHTPMNDFPEY